MYDPNSAPARSRTGYPPVVTPPHGERATAHRAPASRRAMMRRYQVTALSGTGETVEFSRLAPAVPAFEQAFAAFARGTVIATDTGPVAIEDLMLRDRALVAEEGPQPVCWIGSMTLFPANLPGQAETPGPVRLTADRFGPGRPAHDIVLGPHARLLQRNRAIDAGAERAYVPVAEMVDGSAAIRLTPAAPVQVFHIALPRHGTLRAGGLDVESFHPGPSTEDSLGGDLAALFLSLFPHLRCFGDFGPLAHPQRPLPSARKPFAA